MIWRPSCWLRTSFTSGVAIRQACWRCGARTGLDGLLARAWAAGVVLCGVSAGMNCWFEQSVTDSFGTGTARATRRRLGSAAGELLSPLRRRGSASAGFSSLHRVRRAERWLGSRRRRRARLLRDLAQRGGHLSRPARRRTASTRLTRASASSGWLPATSGERVRRPNSQRTGCRGMRCNVCLGACCLDGRRPPACRTGVDARRRGVRDDDWPGIAHASRCRPATIGRFNAELIDNHRVGHGPLAPDDVARATMLRLVNGFAAIKPKRQLSPDAGDRSFAPDATGEAPASDLVEGGSAWGKGCESSGCPQHRRGAVRFRRPIST